MSPALAAGSPAQETLQRFIQNVQSLSATFEQVQKDERGEVLQSSNGRLWLARPGKFRWVYEKPYEQLMVCDGRSLWLYDPDLAQVTVRPAGASLQGTPAQLLTDRTVLEKHFRVEEAGADPGRGVKVRLVPRAPDSDFRSVELWLMGDVPQRMRFLDALGGTTEVSFSEIRTNAVLDEALFRFTPPKGTEIIQAEEPTKK